MAGLICASASLFVAGIEDAAAATRRWDGSSSALWSDATNWEGGVAPVNGDDLVFPIGASNMATQNDIVGLQINSVLIEAGYSMNGQPVTLGAGGITSNAGSIGWTLETTLSAPQTWTVAPGSVLGRSTTILNGQALTFDIAGDLTDSGAITGDGSVIKTGAGSALFSVANSYTGITQVLGGKLVVSNPNSLGVSDSSVANGTVVNGGTLTLALNVALATERLELNGSGQANAGALALAFNPGENGSVAGPIVLASNTTVRVPQQQALTMFGTMSGAGGIGLDGDGTLALGTTNFFTGDLIIGANGPSSGTIRLLYPQASNLPHDIDVSLPYAASTLDLNGASTVLGSLSGAGSLVLGPASLTIRQNIDTTYTGVMSGSGSFAKNGTGRLALTGNHTVSGNADAVNGTLAVIGGSLAAASTATYLSSTLSLISNPQLGTLYLGTTSTLALDEGGPQTARSLNFQMFGSPTLRVGVNNQTDACSQLRVTGTVSLDGHLAITHVPGSAPDAGFTCIIIDNDGTDPVTGGFDGVGEGGLVSAGAAGFRVSYVGGDGNDVTLTDATRKYYLSEGATGSFFDLDILLANPNTQAVPVELTFLPEGGAPPHVETIELEPLSRRTIRVDDIAALQNVGATSTVVTSMNALPIMVERTMRWDSTGYGAHTDKASNGPALKWYFAEGSQGFFQTYLLLANPTTEQVGGEVEYLLDNAPPVKGGGGVDPLSRRTIWAGETNLGLNGQSFGMVVTFDKPAIAERAMYFGEAFAGGHESAGVNELSTTWFLAEGATGPFFETFVLLANPNDAAADVTLRFLPASGQPIQSIKSLPGRSRLTVNIEGEHPLLENVPVATQVTSTQPIVVERAQYWPDPAPRWHEAHNSFGVTQLATRWGLAEGRVGGPSNYQTYILLANPGTVKANVTIQFLRASGQPVTKTFEVDPAARFNVSVGPGTLVPELNNEEFGAVITSNQLLAVERALYSDANGLVWAAGTNATAVRLP